jgi:hypothetical protein
VKSDAVYKRRVWESFEMSLRGEVDPELVEFFWHWLMYPLLDMIGPELVYSIGLECLGYPPTWVDLKEEADLVEAAVIEFLEKKVRK